MYFLASVHESKREIYNSSGKIGKLKFGLGSIWRASMAGISAPRTKRLSADERRLAARISHCELAKANEFAASETVNLH